MTEELDRDWSGPEGLAELLEVWREGLLGELHTAAPGIVESYDATTQRADVRPAIRRTLYNERGEPRREDFPVLRAVRVIQPRAGGFTLHVPLAAGDGVLLVFAERDPSRWLTTGEVSDAPDARTHHVAHALAIPGLFPRTADLSPAPPTDALVIGTEDSTARITLASDGTATVEATTIKLGSAGTTKHVALAEDVEAELAKIAAAFAGAQAPSGGGAVTYTPGSAYTTPITPVGASKVEAE